MKRIAWPTVAMLFIVAAFIGCERRKAEEPFDAVRVQLGWTHQAQWVGFYAAAKNGYYAEERLAVELLPRPSATTNTIALVMGGAADFGTTNAINLIVARSRGHSLTAIGAIYRRDPWVLMTLPGSDIERPQDFPGHTISTLNPGGNGLVFRAMMNKLGLDPDSVRQVETGFDSMPFYLGEVDIWGGFLTNEVLSARAQGYPVNVILPDYYGIHLYGMVLIAAESLIERNPDLVLRFLRATLRGWRWAIENPEQAARLTLSYDPELDLEHEIAVVEAGIPLIHTGEDQIGWMNGKVWQNTHDMLLGQGILTEPLDMGRVYTMEFLLNIYQEEQ